MKDQATTVVALALSLVLGAAPALAAGKPPAKKPAATAARHVTPAKPVKSAKAKPAPHKAAPVVAARKPAKPAPVAAKPAASGTQTAKTRPAVTTAANAKPAVPPAPQVATFIPLGPERFYPNGIPELRPEFMHPLPDQQAQAVREKAEMQQASEDRRSWFAAPQ